MTTATFAKTITFDRETHDYRATLDGQLIGYFETPHAAEVALDETAYDWLIHGCDQPASALDGGDPPSDPVPDDFPGEDIDGVPYPHAPASPICRGCNTNEYPASAIQSHFCIECVNAMLHGLPNRFRAAEEAAKLAHTRQSIAVEATMRRCHNCGADHRTWRCPEIGDKLFAPENWKDIALGRELCKMRWRHFPKFVALLRSLPPASLLMYADSYVAFIHDYNPASDLNRRDVLKVWARLIGDARLAA